MASPHHENILTTLTDLQSRKLSIIRLSEPISSSAAQTADHPKNRTSNTSTDNFETHSPAGLAADLNHYKVRCTTSPNIPSSIHLRKQYIYTKHSQKPDRSI